MPSDTVFRHRSGATKYQPKISFPPNFSQIVQNFTRELLRSQPENIYTWSANYFKELALSEDPLYKVQEPPPDHYAPTLESEVEMMLQEIIDVFQSIDSESTGKLSVQLVKRILMETLSLTREQALHVLSSEETEIASDGTLQYVPFLKSNVYAIVYFQQTQMSFPVVEHIDDSITVHGMTRQELEDELMRVMQHVDSEGVGRLRLTLYRDTLKNVPLQLTRRDINLLLVEAMVGADGTVGYVQEIATAFPLICLSESFTALDLQQKEITNEE